MEFSAASDWVPISEIELPFQTKSYHKNLQVRKITVDLDEHQLEGYEFLLPNNKSKLTWFAWPEWIDKPVIPDNSEYHSIKVLGNEVLQPRKTRCYVHSYKYSNTWHPLEKEVPDDIQNLLDWTTLLYNADDEEKYGTPMCLVNEYTTLRHCIGVHSDDEEQFGTLRDVICWVDGATRRLILRDKKTKAMVLNLELPEGLYIMRGRSFQKDYTHEIPRAMDSTFEELRKLLPEKIKSHDKNQIADWMSANSKWVKENTESKLYQRYLKWNQIRVSYTVRFFKEQ